MVADRDRNRRANFSVWKLARWCGVLGSEQYRAARPALMIAHHVVRVSHSFDPFSGDDCLSRFDRREIYGLCDAVNVSAGQRFHRIGTHILSYEDIETSVVSGLILERTTRAQLFEIVCEFAETCWFCWIRSGLSSHLPSCPNVAHMGACPA